MPKANRGPLFWRAVVVFVGGVILIGVATWDVLPWLQRVFLVMGVTFVAGGLNMERINMERRPARDATREE